MVGGAASSPPNDAGRRAMGCLHRSRVDLCGGGGQSLGGLIYAPTAAWTTPYLTASSGWFPAFKNQLSLPDSPSPTSPRPLSGTPKLNWAPVWPGLGGPPPPRLGLADLTPLPQQHSQIGLGAGVAAAVGDVGSRPYASGC